MLSSRFLVMFLFSLFCLTCFAEQKNPNLESRSRFLPRPATPLSPTDAKLSHRIEQLYEKIRRRKKYIIDQKYRIDSFLTADIASFEKDLSKLHQLISTFSDSSYQKQVDFIWNLLLIEHTQQRKSSTFSNRTLLANDAAFSMMNFSDVDDDDTKKLAKTSIRTIVEFAQRVNFASSSELDPVNNKKILDEEHIVALQVKSAKEALMTLEHIPELSKYHKRMQSLYIMRLTAYLYPQSTNYLDDFKYFIYGENLSSQENSINILNDAEFVATYSFQKRVAAKGGVEEAIKLLETLHKIRVSLKEDPDRFILIKNMFGTDYDLFNDMAKVNNEIVEWEARLQANDPTAFLAVSEKMKAYEIRWWEERASSENPNVAWQRLGELAQTGDVTSVVAYTKLVKLRNLDRRMAKIPNDDDEAKLLLWENFLEKKSPEAFESYLRELPSFERAHVIKMAFKRRPGAIERLEEMARENHVDALNAIIHVYEWDVLYTRRDMKEAGDPAFLKRLPQEDILDEWKIRLDRLEQE